MTLRPGTSGNSALCPYHWPVKGASLQSVLDHWPIFQELWDGILEGRVNLEVRGQVKGVQTQMLSFNFFFVINWEF